ncbi:MAG TPA: hypothetical protein ENJ08_10540 [Gammaproteobacteria bacterium]|nr:hypothetical protein [Gammaproteobacteria bacterium]
MNDYADKTHTDRSQSVTSTTFKKQNDSEPTFQFADNRSKTITQRKLQEMMGNSTQAIQMQSIADNYTVKQQPVKLKEANIIQRNKSKRKGKGKFSTVGASPAAQAVTNMFIQQHIGNKAAATQMAQNRASTGITVSHTIDITETARLLSEMQQRINTGYYIPDNQVASPHAGGMQYLTNNSYKIWQTKVDKRGRIKAPKLTNNKFYYDVLGIAGNALHHFDGPA